VVLRGARVTFRRFPGARRLRPRLPTRRPCFGGVLRTVNNHNLKLEICDLCSRNPAAGPFQRPPPTSVNQIVSVCLSYSVFFVQFIYRTHLAAQLNPASSGQIGGRGDTAMSAIEMSLTALKEASALAERIPFIAPVAGLLIQAITMRDASVPLLPRGPFILPTR